MLWMHPVDARNRNIQDKQTVLVASAQGKTQVPVKVTKDIMAGVVCLAQGIWPDLDENGIDHAGATNMLTSTEPTKPSRGSRTHSVAVEVQAAPDYA